MLGSATIEKIEKEKIGKRGKRLRRKGKNKNRTYKWSRETSRKAKTDGQKTENDPHLKKELMVDATQNKKIIQTGILSAAKLFETT
jgi:hypothetical protein